MNQHEQTMKDRDDAPRWVDQPDKPGLWLVLTPYSSSGPGLAVFIGIVSTSHSKGQWFGPIPEDSNE